MYSMNVHTCEWPLCESLQSANVLARNRLISVVFHLYDSDGNGYLDHGVSLVSIRSIQINRYH